MNETIIKNILTKSNKTFDFSPLDTPLNKLINEHSLWGQITSEDKKIKGFKKKNLIHNMVFLQEFTALCTLFDKNNLPPPVPLKGLSLLKRIYPLGSERMLTDIDLLFPIKYKKQISDLLLNQSYFKVDDEKWHANRHKQIYQKRTPLMTVTFEFHFQLYYHSTYQPQIVEQDGAKLLSHEDEMIYLCYHLAEQHNFIKLFWLNDISKYIDTLGEKINWTKTEEIAKEIGVERSLNLCLFLCSHFLNSHSQYQNNIPREIKKILTWTFLCYPRRSRFNYHRLKFYLKKNRAINYYLGWTFQRLISIFS